MQKRSSAAVNSSSISDHHEDVNAITASSSSVSGHERREIQMSSLRRDTADSTVIITSAHAAYSEAECKSSIDDKYTSPPPDIENMGMSNNVGDGRRSVIGLDFTMNALHDNDTSHHRDGNRLSDWTWMELEPKVCAAVREDLLGESHKGVRQFFYMLDPFKAEQFVRAPKQYEDINMIFALIFFTGVLAFSIFAFIAYSNRPIVESWSIELTSSTPPLKLQLKTACSTQYGCGTYNNATDEFIGPIVSVQYNDVDSGYCKNKEIEPFTINTDYAKDKFSVYDCYSQNNDDGMHIQIPFAINSDGTLTDPGVYFTVTISTPDVNDNHKLIYEQEVNPHQRKSIFLTQTVYHLIDGTEEIDPAIEDLFYDGKNDGMMSNLRIKMKQFAAVSETTQPGTIFDTFGSIGGFAAFLMPVLTMLRGVTVMTYKSVFVLKQLDARSGLCAKALHLLTEACLRCVGTLSGHSSGSK